jgi:hypothetical protein
VQKWKTKSVFFLCEKAKKKSNQLPICMRITISKKRIDQLFNDMLTFPGGSFHIARRTFATTVTLSNGIPI